MYIHLKPLEVRQLDKLTRLSYLLMESPLPATVLADRMSVSRATIYRLLDLLQALGLPLAREQRDGTSIFSLNSIPLRKLRKFLRKQLLGRKVHPTMVAIANTPSPSIDRELDPRLFKLAYLATSDARASAELVRLASQTSSPLAHLVGKLRDTLPPPADFYDLEFALRAGTTIPVNADTPKQRVLVWELAHRCLAMTLQSVTPARRLAYLLTEVLGLDIATATTLLDIKESAVRTRVCRARQDVSRLLGARCSYLDPENLCICTNRLGSAIRAEIVGPPTLPLPDELPRVLRRREANSLLRSLPILPPGAP